MFQQKRNNKSAKGFTLIELMIVVVILGILAAVAIPTFTKFIRKSKTGEVPNNIRAIQLGAALWYEEVRRDASGVLIKRHFPNGSSPYGTVSGTYNMPVVPLCAGGNTKYSKNVALWSAEPWNSIGFQVKESHYYRYRYVVNNSDLTFTTMAVGDLDCDGVFSTYKIITKRKGASSDLEKTDVIVTKGLE